MAFKVTEGVARHMSGHVYRILTMQLCSTTIQGRSLTLCVLFKLNSAHRCAFLKFIFPDTSIMS